MDKIREALETKIEQIERTLEMLKTTTFDDHMRQSVVDQMLQTHLDCGLLFADASETELRELNQEFGDRYSALDVMPFC